jgi:hypothetical protein
MSDHIITIEKSFCFSHEDVDDLLGSALDFIDYWCEWVLAKGVKSDSFWLSQTLTEGGTLTFKCHDDDEEYVLTLEQFLNGIKRVLEDGEFSSAEDLMENHDANDADNIVQYALFNEIVFA